MIYAFGLFLPILALFLISVVSRGDASLKEFHTRPWGIVFLAIPAVVLVYSTYDADVLAKLFFVSMQWIWLPLVLQDLKTKTVNAVGLSVVSGLTIAGTYFVFGIEGGNIINSLVLIMLFATLHVFYLLVRGRVPFGAGDYPTIFALSLSLNHQMFGPWIIIASSLGLAQAIGKQGSLNRRVALIPLLYMSWQFCVGLPS